VTRRLPIAALVAAAALCASLAAAPASWEPAPTPETSALEGASWAVRTDAYVATLESLDDAQRWRYLRERAGAAADPFSAPDGPGFLTFRLTLESRAAGTLVFDAGGTRLVTQDKTTRYPLDLPSIESAYGLLEREVPPAYRTIRGALFDGTVFLGSGQRAEGLLVFQGVSPRTRAFRIEVPLTTQDGSPGGLSAAYRRARR
jgi:hypothetical protein